MVGQLQQEAKGKLEDKGETEIIKGTKPLIYKFQEGPQMGKVAGREVKRESLS